MLEKPLDVVRGGERTGKASVPTAHTRLSDRRFDLGRAANRARQIDWKDGETPFQLETSRENHITSHAGKVLR